MRRGNNSFSNLDKSLPLLRLPPDTVLLPGGYVRVNISAGSSGVALVERLLRNRSSQSLADVAAVPTRPEDEEGAAGFGEDHLYSSGTAARVMELLRAASNKWVAVLEGRCRVTLGSKLRGPGGAQTVEVKQVDYFNAGPHARDPAEGVTKEEAALQAELLTSVQEIFAAASQGRGRLGTRTLEILKNYGPALTSDVLGSLLAPSPSDRLVLLSQINVALRLRSVAAMLQQRLAAAGLAAASYLAGRRNQSRQKPTGRNSSSGSNRDDEAAAGADADSDDDAAGPGGDPRAVMAKLKAAQPPAEVLEAAHAEYRRLKRTNAQHPGYSATLSYLETLADLPWQRSAGATRRPSLAAVLEQLDADHAGLNKVKQRIVQFVAVQSLRGWDARAPVLCLVGPPGVGKTSVARSMAAALRRPFRRISLGGVRDEAEIRGHRRTYVGAMPGRIVDALRRAGARDAVLLLDEVDKTGRDARGDPAAALLEVLDPEQNAAFMDHYLGVPVDLSKIIFVCTANSAADIPPALYDRFEVVNLSGYTVDEKMAIAERHLVPRALVEHGISPGRLKFPPATLRLLAEGYTREAGVRDLARALAAVCRHVAVKLVAEGEVEIAAPLLAEEAMTFLPCSPSGGEESHPEEPEASAAAFSAVLGSAWSSSGTRRRLQGQEVSTASTEQQPFAPPSLSLPPALPLRLLGEGSMGLVTPEPGPSSHPPHDSCQLPPAAPPAVAAAAAAAPLPPPITVDSDLIGEVLGPSRYQKHDEQHRISSPGTAAGLVWTAAGGAVQYIECCATSTGRAAAAGGLTLTGSLGDVLEESATLSLSWVRSHAAALGLPQGEACPARAWDIHVHLPSGAVPKDGPSAGVTLAVALVSLFTGKCVRADTAMTGELTLRGLVLPVGGVKEKVLAAAAAGLRRVILPSRNLRGVESELPEAARAGVELIPVERLEQVLAAAFDPPLELLEEHQEQRYPVARL